MEKHSLGKTARRAGVAAKSDKEISIQLWSIDKLVEYANNPRDHDHAIAKMAATIKEFGFKVPVIATSNGEVVDGHLRLKAARSLGLKKVPVVLADDLSQTQIKAFRLSVNETTNWAQWNPEKLEAELASLKAVQFAPLEVLGLDSIELPDLEDAPIAPPPRANRNKTTIFLSVRNEDVQKARKAVIAALNKSGISHNL